MSWETVAYGLSCIVLPMAWGLVVVWASNWIEAKVAGRDRSQRRSRRRKVRPIEYHI